MVMGMVEDAERSEELERVVEDEEEEVVELFKACEVVEYKEEEEGLLTEQEQMRWHQHRKKLQNYF